MIRILSLAAVVAAVLAAPASAADDATVKAPKPTAATIETAPGARSNLFTEQQARSHLTRQGYTNVSELAKDENGAWRGSATKDGKTTIVAVDIKGDVRAR